MEALGEWFGVLLGHAHEGGEGELAAEHGLLDIEELHAVGSQHTEKRGGDSWAVGSGDGDDGGEEPFGEGVLQAGFELGIQLRVLGGVLSFSHDDYSCTSGR